MQHHNATQIPPIPSADPAAPLGQMPLFAAAQPADLKALGAQFQRRTYRRNEVILHRGDAAGALHIIVSGRVKVTLPSEEGDETVLALLGAGDYFGEMAALDGSLRSATVTAVEPTETRALLREALLAYVRTNPEFALGLVATLSARVRKTNELLEDSYYQDLETRLARRLLDLVEAHGQPARDGIDVAFPLTQSDLAGMLGATRARVNRALGTFQDEGLLRLGHRAFTVLRLDALRERAGR